ncbi:MAG TPA: sulfite reductase subunit alpha, partial [Pseudolabrys sp.]|nr:sulfite reductase subunit alpha [Pseudolabrys sp.]
MTQNVPSPFPSLIPETAPFSEEQRDWLNGFFAGLISLDGSGVTPLSDEQAAALLAGGAIAKTADEDDGGAPWHDQTISLVDRMKLADGKPLRWRLMAAMAQQDCGQCGYDCRNYSGAIFSGKEERLNLCVPGGKETARMLKKLHEELKSAPPAPAGASLVAAEAAPVAEILPRYSRDNPALATVLSCKRLNKPGSEKETWHVELNVSSRGLEYAVGDSFGLFPSNDPALVDAVLKALDAPADFPIGGRTLREVLCDGVSLSPAPDMLFQLFSYITGGERRIKARALANGDDPDGDAETLDVLAAIEKFPGIRPDPEAFIEALDPLQPRLYSISSSPKLDPRRVALTVDAVRFDTEPAVPIVMIGPGTGVAPFRAFLQERWATQASGRNWLFFGHQRSNCDFFYEDEFRELKASGLLTRLSLAWSRDGGQKI